MALISHVGVICPLVLAIERFDEELRQEAFHIADKDDVIFAVEVNPALIALFAVLALCAGGSLSVENLIQAVFMQVTQVDTKILTQGHIAIRMDDEA